MTAHVNTEPGDFAPTVIMPGDSFRARFITENYLVDYRKVINVYNVSDYTGLYFEQPASVIGHGMDILSMALYAHKLVHDFGVQRTVRVNGSDATRHHVRMHDIIPAIAAGTDSVISLRRSAGYAMAISTYSPLLQQAWTLAQKAGTDIKVGNVSSGDLYCGPDESLMPALEKLGVLGVDMEVADLYTSAHQSSIEALAILTVSDRCLTGEETTVEE